MSPSPQHQTKRRNAPADGDSASGRVLLWLETHIRNRSLGVGDALPYERDIASATGAGRSSVREALTALKALGLIRSRRKGGIRIERNPGLLELRHYFDLRFYSSARFEEAMEFRAALEWGCGPLMFVHAGAETLAEMRAAVATVTGASPGHAAIEAAEIRFHSALIGACGNRLASLLSQLYGPIFATTAPAGSSPAEIRQWQAQHQPFIDALAAHDETAFLEALRRHTHTYMRLRKKERQSR